MTDLCINPYFSMLSALKLSVDVSIEVSTERTAVWTHLLSGGGVPGGGCETLSQALQASRISP